MKILKVLVLNLFFSLSVFASDVEPVLDQEAGLRFNLFSLSLLECNQQGDGLALIFYFGTTREEFLKSVARFKGLSTENLDYHYGPYDNYADWSRAAEAFSNEAIEYFQNSNLSLWKNIPEDTLPLKEMTQDMGAWMRHPWMMNFRDQYVNPVIHQYAKKVGWSVYTTVTILRGELKSEFCKDDQGNWVEKREIRNARP